jgi:excisionase family DNA binding protein
VSTPRLVTTKEAAELLSVSPRTVLNWIQDGAIPYVELPSRGGQRREYRIPLHGLLRSLAGNYDLAEEFRSADEAVPSPAENGVAVEAPAVR